MDNTANNLASEKTQNSSDLNEDTKIQQLKTKIEELTQIQPPIEIRCGFPPKVLTAADDDTLKSSGISSGGEIDNFCTIMTISGVFVLLNCRNAHC